MVNVVTLDGIVRLGGSCTTFCRELKTNGRTDWLRFRHQIMLSLGLRILNDKFSLCIYPICT